MIQPQDQTSELTPSRKIDSFTLSSADVSLWRALYLRAIFERDRTKIPDRIREAARALMLREHELCTAQKDWTERQSVITALHCLEAFRYCLEIPSQERFQEDSFSRAAVKRSINSISWE
jgi:hypothetical protein